jgi:hypothetical protein
MFKKPGLLFPFLQFPLLVSLLIELNGILSNKTRLDVPVATGFFQGILGIAITNQSTPNIGT